MASRNRTPAVEADQVLTPAVAYVRMSSDKQEESPAQQRAEIASWATANNYTILRWYEDDGISGWKATRAQFQRMIDDAEKRKDFRAIVVWDQNRFSRFPPVESCYYWHRLDQADVHLASCNQGRIEWDSIAGFLTASIRQHADSEHRFKLSADVKRGKQAVAERGLWQTKIPYGYQLGTDRKLTPGEPSQVDTVVRIFSECVAGRSLRGIAVGLNNQGIPAPRGGMWAGGVIHGILRNPAYAGIYRHRDVVLPGHHPAIVDEVTFSRIGRLLDGRKTNTTPIQGGGGFLFSQLVKCGKCGSSMPGLRSGAGSHRYVCGGALRHGKIHCDSNTAYQDELLATVTDAIVEWADDPDVVAEFKANIRRLIAEETTVADPVTIRSQLASIDAKLIKAKRRLLECDSDMLATVQEGLRSLLSERDRLQAALTASLTPVADVLQEADEQIEESFTAFLGLGEAVSEASPEAGRELIRKAVERIDVWSERNGDGRFHLDHGHIDLRQDNNLYAKPGL